MTTEMFYENLCEHLDIALNGEYEIDPEICISIRVDDEGDDYNAGKLHPSFKNLISGNKPLRYLEKYNDSLEDKLKKLRHQPHTFGLYSFICGIFGIEEKDIGVKVRMKNELIKYFIEGDFCINIKPGQMGMSKVDFMSICYICHILQEQNYDSMDLPDIALDGELIDVGTATITIEPKMYHKMINISEYCKEHFEKKDEPGENLVEKKEKKKVNEKVKILKQKTHIDNEIHSVDMRIKQKYFDFIYDELFGHIDTSNLSNKRSHRNDMKRKFMKQDPFDIETKKIDYTLHAFCVYFNHRVDKLITC
jgi:hypothetical protein